MTNRKRRQVTREELLKRIEGAAEDIEQAEFELSVSQLHRSECYGAGYGDAVDTAYRHLDFVVSLLTEYDKKNQ